MANDFKDMDNKDLNSVSNDDTMSTNNKENSTVSKKKKEKKRIKATLLLLLIIVMPFILISGIFITTYNVLTADERAEKKEITNKAVEYFSEKYDIKKKDIKIEDNNLYGKKTHCYFSCGENELIITYNNKQYTIKYDEKLDSYGDDFQYDRIHRDFYEYLSDKTKFASKFEIEYLYGYVMRTPQKYEANIRDYIKNMTTKRDSTDSYVDDFRVVYIWIEAKTKEEAKVLKERYATELAELTNVLEDLHVGYKITISKDVDDNELDSFYYYLMSSDEFRLYDNVDNETLTCSRGNFEGGTCVHGTVRKHDV